MFVTLWRRKFFPPGTGGRPGLPTQQLLTRARCAGQGTACTVYTDLLYLNVWTTRGFFYFWEGASAADSARCCHALMTVCPPVWNARDNIYPVFHFSVCLYAVPKALPAHDAPDCVL